MPAREPRRRGGEERERRERHPREERDGADVPAKALAREEPEQPGDEVRRQEVAHVDGPGRVVVPAQVRRPVPEPVLQPDGRDGAAEEEGIRLELRPVPGREEQAVGVSAQQVVDREHERERQPLEDDAPQPAARDSPSRARAGRARSRGAAAPVPPGRPLATCTRSARRRRGRREPAHHAEARGAGPARAEAMLSSDMSEHQVERPRHLAEIERLDEQARVAGLPAAAAAHEAPKLILGGSASPLRLLLEGAEGSEVALRVDDLLHARRHRARGSARPPGLRRTRRSPAVPSRRE